MEIKGACPQTARYAPLSLSGVPLEGEKLVRCIFFDESGVSQEPMLVVAGVIIHGDSHWRALEAALRKLRDKYVPESEWQDFAFRATDMFHGSGHIFGRHLRPVEESRAALREVLAIPSQFKLPIAVGYIKKHGTPETPSERNHSASMHHAIAASYCAIAANKHIKTRFPDELATAVAENNTVTRKAVKQFNALLKTGRMGGLGTASFMLNISSKDLPLTHIPSGVHFVEKKEEPLLQLADVCAFTMRRFLQKQSGSRELFAALGGRKCGMCNPNGGYGMIQFE